MLNDVEGEFDDDARFFSSFRTPRPPKRVNLIPQTYMSIITHCGSQRVGRRRFADRAT